MRPHVPSNIGAGLCARSVHVRGIVPGPLQTALPRIRLQYRSRGMASFFPVLCFSSGC